MLLCITIYMYILRLANVIYLDENVLSSYLHVIYLLHKVLQLLQHIHKGQQSPCWSCMDFLNFSLSNVAVSMPGMLNDDNIAKRMHTSVLSRISFRKFCIASSHMLMHLLEYKICAFVSCPLRPPLPTACHKPAILLLASKQYIIFTSGMSTPDPKADEAMTNLTVLSDFVNSSSMYFLSSSDICLW